MTDQAIRERLKAMPGPVLTVIKVISTHANVTGAASDFNECLRIALATWDELVEQTAAVDPAVTETEQAEFMIGELRKQEVWGKILRRGTN